MPVRRTRMKTSLMPNVGSGISSSHSPGSACALTSAFTVSPDCYGNRTLGYGEGRITEAREEYANGLHACYPAKRPSPAPELPQMENELHCILQIMTRGTVVLVGTLPVEQLALDRLVAEF